MMLRRMPRRCATVRSREKMLAAAMAPSSAARRDVALTLLRTMSVNASPRTAAPATAVMAHTTSLDEDEAALSPLTRAMTPTSQPRELSFRDTEKIFRSKTTADLVRAYGVFGVSKFSWLVKHSDKLINASYMFLGANVTNAMLRATFFGHFCAGEDANEIKPVIRSLSKYGIGGILDYAAEADVEHPRDLNGISQNLVSARTYEYEDESTCDANAAIARQAIIDAGATKAEGEPAFAAIKCTALGKPELLMRMSSIIVQAQLLFHTLDGPNLSRAKSQYMEKLVDYPALSAGLRNAGVNMEEDEVRELFVAMDSSKDGVIDYVDWVSYLDPMDLTMGPLTQFIEEEPLNEREKVQLRNMIHRLESLANEADANDVKLMVDAEQTYMQPGIDHLVLNLQRQYNRNKRDTIYNTFQCYLKISSDRVDIDLERARRENFQFACKLVRGAYMIQERKRARDKGYSDPIHNSIEDTHENYNMLAEKLLHNNSIASFMVASHNEDSVQNTVRLMKELGIDRREGGVYFGQLLGMCDHVSYSLGDHAYRVFKYVPYGPIDEVLPYLVRRAQENSGLMGGANKEMGLIKTEVLRRLTGGARS